MSEGLFRREYIARFNRVLDYIDRHLADELRLETLAEVALFSPFHFHRLFQAWQGETLADYIRRRRLEIAASRLVNLRDCPVLTIALDCGFGSGESFARAFRQQFGCSPSAWRKLRQAHRKMDQVDRKESQDRAAASGDDAPVTHPLWTGSVSEESKMSKNLSVSVESLPASRIAYMRRTGPYGPGIQALWADFNKWCSAHGFHGQRMMFGLFLDNPDITAPELCRYDVSVEVDEDFVPDGEVAVRELPGGRYALLDFFGSPTECVEAWDALMRDWLPDSGYQVDDRPCFERYRPQDPYEPETRRFGCQIAIPVRPL